VQVSQARVSRILLVAVVAFVALSGLGYLAMAAKVLLYSVAGGLSRPIGFVFWALFTVLLFVVGYGAQQVAGPHVAPFEVFLGVMLSCLLYGLLILEAAIATRQLTATLSLVSYSAAALGTLTRYQRRERSSAAQQADQADSCACDVRR
jgi:hypothetical protein